MGAAIACAGLAAALAPAAGADPWAAPGDTRLRHDLQLLADAGILYAPVSAWPVSWGEVARDIGRVHGPDALPAYLEAALARVQQAAATATGTDVRRVEIRLAGAHEPVALRRFGELPREEGEVGGALQLTGERYAIRLQATGASDPSDGRSFRPDGSYAALLLGNWAASAGYVDRWWGPGWEGSLILGTNARPLPSLALERNFSDPPGSRWLAWIGRWRLVAILGQFEGGRNDAPDARFFAMRLTWKPHPRVEVGLSRTAQWCGEGRPCDFDTFVDLFLGRDNDQAPADQPGNQLAGFDARWSLPGAPVAVYAQAIGEDEANGLPSQYLGLFGVEAWGGWGSRSWRAHAEYADTECAFYETGDRYGCAYWHSIYTDGYQYRGRSVGHALDGDGRQFALGLQLVEADGSSWELLAQDSDLNRGAANPVHSVSPIAATLRSADLAHRRRMFDGELAIRVGYEERESASTMASDDGVRGFVSWSRHF